MVIGNGNSNRQHLNRYCATRGEVNPAHSGHQLLDQKEEKPELLAYY